MREYLLLLAAFALFLSSPPVLAGPPPSQNPSSESTQNRSPQNDSPLSTLRVTTREVLVDLIALDRHNQPILDLKPTELQVSESVEVEPKKKRKKKAQLPDAPASIASLSIVDPNRSPSSADDAQSGFRIL
jgi:hypothetical protein